MYRYVGLRTPPSLFVLFSLFLFSTLAHAARPVPSLSDDLQTLVSEGNDVTGLLSSMSLNRDNSCSELGSASAAVRAFTASVETLTDNLPSSLSLDTESMDALDELSLISANMAAVLPVLSSDINTILSGDATLPDVYSAIDAMLRLSDDIGTMADRILEMADKILLMADNIGDMAERILLTQSIQSINIALTQAAMLTTQENMIAVAATVSTSVYDTPLGSLISVGSELVSIMNNTPLTSTNMSTELADLQLRVDTYLASAVTLLATVNADSAVASHYITSDTLTMLGDLSLINAQLATALNAYASAVSTLAPDTDIAVLNDAIASMLRLTADIGVMANRIVEMGDRINIMADNIGLMVLRINETQTLQQSNVELTQSNLTAAQITAVQIIAAFGL